MNSHPSEDDKATAIVLHFASRLMLVFSEWCFLDQFTEELDSLRNPGGELQGLRKSFILPTIHDACLHTTLMALRDLDDFFSPKRGRTDDLKASELGFQDSLSFLTADERERINKLAMHSTQRAPYESPETAWDIGELTAKCVSQSLHFLKWIETNHLPPQSTTDSKAWAAAVFLKMRIESVLEYAKKMKAKHAD